MDTNDIIKKLEDSDEDILRDIITEWMKEHRDFRKHLECRLYPSVYDLDFGFELARKAYRETKEYYQRNCYSREATDWSAVYYDLVKPWSEQAEYFPTSKLYELVMQIITEVGMRITEDDFCGDDWYGDDFSGSIDSIRNMDMTLEAQKVMDENLDFPDVCQKKYGELVADNNWKDALQLLDEAQKSL